MITNTVSQGMAPVLFQGTTPMLSRSVTTVFPPDLFLGQQGEQLSYASLAQMTVMQVPLQPSTENTEVVVQPVPVPLVFQDWVPQPMQVIDNLHLYG